MNNVNNELMNAADFECLQNCENCFAMEQFVGCQYNKNKEEKGDRTMTLGDAKVGTTVVVTKIEGDGAYKRRIMDMGITKGSELYIRKVAPLGDPVEITVRGYELSVRKNDAQCVQVK